LIKVYVEKNHVVAQKQEDMAQKLQDFIDKENLSIEDMDVIKDWITQENYLYAKLYYRDMLIYDSISQIEIDIDKVEIAKEEENSTLNEVTVKNILNSYYTLSFKDGTLSALFYCFPETQMLDYARIVLILLACVLFFVSIAVFIQRKVRYLLKLEKEVRQLTEVSLEMPITIEGNDEITAIARGIEYMRKSVLEQMIRERESYESNQELMTALSHDLRTPLTSLIGYLEILQKGGNTEEEKALYLNISLEKSLYLKKLTDSLFEYSYIQSNSKQIEMEVVNGNELIMQMVEETLLDLELLGIVIERKISDVNCKLFLNVNMIHRVFENIFSNIKKYADLRFPVTVEYKKDSNELMVFFTNHKKAEEKKSGTQIGLKSCKYILNLHHGKLKIEEKEDYFSIAIYLPIYR
jgi:signal transduction histidine kinase